MSDEPNTATADSDAKENETKESEPAESSSGDFGSVKVEITAVPVHAAKSPVSQTVDVALKEGEDEAKALDRYRTIIQDRISTATNPEDHIGWIRIAGTLYNLESLTVIRVEVAK